MTDPILVRVNWPFAAIVIAIILTVSGFVLTLVLTHHISDSALWALGAWVAGMIKGALIPAFFYDRERKRASEGISFTINPSDPPKKL